MCWACEEDALWWRYQLEMAVEQDEIPPGFEPADFEWAGLPVPSKRAPATDAHAEPTSAEPVAPAVDRANATTQDARVRKPANSFVCDSPDGA